MSRLFETLDTQTAYASASKTVTAVPPAWARYAIFHFNLSAVAGTTPIADCKLQAVDPASGSAIDLDGATFAQLTAAGYQLLEIGPVLAGGADSTGNHRRAHALIPSKLQAVFTFDRTTANETYTFTLAVEWLS